MNSISFPKMFNTTTTKVVTGYDATLQNLKLFLFCEVGELFGDPAFGIKLKRYMFDQNNIVLHEILVDEIYSKLHIFMPQLIVERRNIKITGDKAVCTITIVATNRSDFVTNMYAINLFRESER